MFPLSLALAVAIVTAEGEPLGDSPCDLETIRLAAISVELMDPRERLYMLRRPDEYAADVKLLRRRQAELRDAPPLCDAIRFPSREDISEALSFNRRYRETLTALEWTRADWIASARVDAGRLYQTWDTLRDAQCGYYYVTVRRAALLRLREDLGAEAYYAGSLPPCVPVWYFKRVD